MELGTKVYCTKDAIKSGVEVVTVAKIRKNGGAFWTEEDKYRCRQEPGCLLDALWIGHNAFLDKEDAIRDARKKIESEILRLKKLMLDTEASIKSLEIFKEDIAI